eukprot:jgi/Galph1/969/GphlegSOOS_G5611.1
MDDKSLWTSDSLTSQSNRFPPLCFQLKSTFISAIQTTRLSVSRAPGSFRKRAYCKLSSCVVSLISSRQVSVSKKLLQTAFEKKKPSYHNFPVMLKNCWSSETFLQCPECGTVYSVEPKEIESERIVRCSECSHEWLAKDCELLELDPSFFQTLRPQEEEQKGSDLNIVASQQARDSTIPGDKSPSAVELNTETKNRNVSRYLSTTVSGGEKVLFVGNLSYRATERDIFRIFSACGEVYDVRIPRQHAKGHRGFAFVKMNDKGAEAALQRLQGVCIVGRPIVLSESVSAKGSNEKEAEVLEQIDVDDLEEEELEEDWDSDFGPDEEMLGHKSDTSGTKFYVSGNSSRKRSTGKE